MCVIIVSGCQLATTVWVKAHPTPFRFSPWVTAGFSHTYKLSSKLTNSCRSVWPKTSHVIAARKMQTVRTVQRSFKPAGRLSDSSPREPATPGISPAGEAGAFEGTAVTFPCPAFFFDL